MSSSTRSMRACSGVLEMPLAASACTTRTSLPSLTILQVRLSLHHVCLTITTLPIFIKYPGLIC